MKKLELLIEEVESLEAPDNDFIAGLGHAMIVGGAILLIAT